MRILFLSLILLSFNCYSQKKASTGSKNNEPTKVQTPVKEEIKEQEQAKEEVKLAKAEEVETPSKEVELYKLLYENQKESYNYLLTVVVGFILFVLGSQIYFNHRYNKTELDKIKGETSAQLNSFGSEIKELFNSLKRDVGAITEKVVYIENKSTDIKKEVEAEILNTRNMFFYSQLELPHIQVNAKRRLTILLELFENEIKGGKDYSFCLRSIATVVMELKEIGLQTFTDLKRVASLIHEDDTSSKELVQDVIDRVGVYAYRRIPKTKKAERIQIQPENWKGESKEDTEYKSDTQTPTP